LTRRKSVGEPIRDLVRRARSRVHSARRARFTQEELWRRELPTEVAFWKKNLETKGLHWPWAYERGIDPRATILDPLITERIDGIASDPVRILDVGAGPLTSVGKVHPGRTLEIVPTDALADEYDRLLADAGVEPPIRTQQCRGEDLLEHFGADSFDLAYARNSLDHSADPLRIIQNMLAVVRPGGFVLLRHYQNEAEIARYEELHQWNFNVRDDHLVVWNRRASHDVTEAVATDGVTEAWIEPWRDEAPFVLAVIHKA
jgi:SAM-dependent methyltransferase